MEKRIQRRQFLQLGAAAGIVAGSATETLGRERPKQIRLGVIGVGRRGTRHVRYALDAGLEIPAICDIKEAHLNRAVDMVREARPGAKVTGYSKGTTDYRRMLQRDDLDSVVVATPMQEHAVMSIDALRAGKHVLSEVAAAMTIEECWGLVRAADETDRTYMLAENACYWREGMMILNMVQQGVFGELTFAECGYVHDIRPQHFEPDGSLAWRGKMARDWAGNIYPTHSLGPVAQWLGINRGDRMVSLVAMASKQAALDDYAVQHFPEGSLGRSHRFKVGDSVNVLIRTAKGVMIDVRCDWYSPRPLPTTTYHALQGLKASYDSRVGGIWFDGRSKRREWELLEDYAQEFEHPLWRERREKALGSGHGGMDYFCTEAFWQCLRSGGPPPIDVYDAAAWSSILPLSHKSVIEGSKPQSIPDFTGGQWETRTRGGQTPPTG